MTDQTLTAPPASRAPGRRDAFREPLVSASLFFAVAVLLHNFDHLRRGGDSVSTDVFVIGSLALVAEIGVVALAVMRHRQAAQAAAATGIALAAGYLFVHFTPARSWLSDSFVSGGASPVSVVAAVLEVTAALVLAAVGIAVLAGKLVPSLRRRSFGDALRHPAVVAMIAGNAVVLGGSLLTR